MQRFASILFTVFMLAHVLVPALPFYLCIEDDGSRARGMHPCCPQTSAYPEAGYPILEHARCCELTPPVTIDTQPPVQLDYDQLVAAQAAVFVAPLPAPLLTTLLSRLGPGHGHPVLRGPPLPLRSVLRI